MADSWSVEEIDAIVADYLDMLRAELAGQTYSKAEHNQRLRAKLRNRTKGSIEYKHQNISAVLLELDAPYIRGYKPMRNYRPHDLRGVHRHDRCRRSRLATRVTIATSGQCVCYPVANDSGHLPVYGVHSSRGPATDRHQHRCSPRSGQRDQRVNRAPVPFAGEAWLREACAPRDGRRAIATSERSNAQLDENQAQ